MNEVTSRIDTCSWCDNPLEDEADEGALAQRHYGGLTFCARCVATYTAECSCRRSCRKREVILPTPESWFENHLGERYQLCAWKTLEREAPWVNVRAALKDDELAGWAQMVSDRHPFVGAIYLFGSRVRGHSHNPARAKRDTDILAFLREGLDHEQRELATKRLFTDTAIGFVGLDLFLFEYGDLFSYCSPDLQCYNILFGHDVELWDEGRDYRMLWERT